MKTVYKFSELDETVQQRVKSEHSEMFGGDVYSDQKFSEMADDGGWTFFKDGIMAHVIQEHA